MPVFLLGTTWVNSRENRVYFTSLKPIMSQDEIQGKMQFLYEGKEVKNVHLLNLRFINNGKESISSSDYERPLIIKVNENAKILTQEIIDENPDNLGVSVNCDNHKLTISPVLLNSRDCFSVKALISDFEDKPKIDGRINGIKKIEKYNEGKVSFIITSLISLALVAIGAFNLDKAELVTVWNYDVSRNILGGISFGLGYFLMFVVMLKNKSMLTISQQIIRRLFVQ